MTGICGAPTRSGGTCSAAVTPPLTCCYLHDPDRSAERKRAAARAGRSRSDKAAREIRDELAQLARDVRAGEVSTGAGGVLATIHGVRLRALETEKKLKEADMEDRLAELEAVLDRLEAGV